MTDHVGKFMKTLHKIYTYIESQQDSNKIRHLFHTISMNNLVKDCYRELDETTKKVNTGGTILKDIREMQKEAEIKHAELLELISSLSETNTTTDGSSVHFGASELRNSSNSFSLLPAKPKIFYGHETELEDIMKMLRNQQSSRIAILGGGGMGKTSLARAALHHPDTLTRFEQRFFVSAEPATTSVELAALIGLHVGLDPAQDLTRAVIHYFMGKLQPASHFTDNMLLAVNLLAHLVDYEGLQNVLARWEIEKTSLLSVGYDRKSNLDASISLSLSSPWILSASKEFKLLSLLSILPNGLSDAELLQGKLPISNILSCKTVLLASSLAYQNNYRLKMHFIIEVLKCYLYYSTPLLEEMLVQVNDPLLESRFYDAASCSAICSESPGISKISGDIEQRYHVMRCIAHLKIYTGDYSTSYNLAREAQHLSDLPNVLDGWETTTKVWNNSIGPERILIFAAYLEGAANISKELDIARAIFKRKHHPGHEQCRVVEASLNLRDHTFDLGRREFQDWSHSSSAEIRSVCLEQLANSKAWPASLRQTRWPLIYLAFAYKAKEKLALHKALLFLRDVFIVHKDKHTACALYIIALDGFTYIDVHQSRAECMLRLGGLAHKHGDIGTAIVHWRTARPSFEKSSQAKAVGEIDSKLARVENIYEENLTLLATVQAPTQWPMEAPSSQEQLTQVALV
ncbi:hypothetical protein C8R45DRAFT_928480 [Mycena sanguinolenta]|nr:hypothetical protein C8R45DRAFT_928480 [Mycena sanguinolenta]